MSDPPEHSGSGPTRRERRRRRLAALGVSLVVACALGEVLVRATIGSPLAERPPLLHVRSHATRGWEMVPGETHFTYHHSVSVNSLGLRGNEVPQTKGDELRVLALGDSLIYGQGVADYETLPHYLEQALAAGGGEGRTWRVINGGLRGYDTTQELALLRELGERIVPDVVILLWYWNDLSGSPIEQLAANLAPWESVCFDLGMPFKGRARKIWRAKEILRRSALLMLAHDAWVARGDDGFQAALGGVSPAEGLARLAAHLDRFVALGESLGFRPIFAVVPELASLRRPHPSEPSAERAAELAAERGLGVIDLRAPLEALTEAAGKVPIIPFDGHYLPSANRAMAEAVAAHLLAPGRAGGR